MKKKKHKIIALAILLFVIIIGVVGYLLILKGNSKPEPKVKKVKHEVKVKEEKKVSIIDLDSNSRPYGVMINNISTVWGYQTGLQEAYLVYEIIVEGGYTRLLALFKDKKLDRIGSVRSSRHYFLDYALENDAIYVHFGWSPQAQSDMTSLGVNNVNFLTYGNGYIRDRSLGLSSEHTAFTSTDKIMEAADYFEYSKTSEAKPVLNYTAEEVDLSKETESIVANSINIVYSNSRNTSYTYDSENKVYKRYQNGIEHTDYNTKKQYTAKNIIVYKVNNYTISGDNKNRQDIENIGSGEGYYITNGYAIPITWTKQSRSSKTIYQTKNGKKLTVSDGNTYIQIMPSGQNLTIE